MKTCSKCGMAKELTAFVLRKGSVDGRQSFCRQCRNAEERARSPGRLAYRQEYRSKNKDRMNEKRREWVEKNKPRLREVARAKARKLYWKDPERAKAYAKKWRADHKEQAMHADRKWKRNNADKILASRRRRRVSDESYFWQIRKQFGLTKDAYLAMLCEQNGLCRVCGGTTDGGRLNVDHSHVEGYEGLGPADKVRLVRGLLCWTCNVAIGLLKDNPNRAERAAAYLRGDLE